MNHDRPTAAVHDGWVQHRCPFGCPLRHIHLVDISGAEQQWRAGGAAGPLARFTRDRSGNAERRLAGGADKDELARRGFWASTL